MLDIGKVGAQQVRSSGPIGKQGGAKKLRDPNDPEFQNELLQMQASSQSRPSGSLAPTVTSSSAVASSTVEDGSGGLKIKDRKAEKAKGESSNSPEGLISQGLVDGENQKVLNSLNQSSGANGSKIPSQNSVKEEKVEGQEIQNSKSALLQKPMEKGHLGKAFAQEKDFSLNSDPSILNGQAQAFASRQDGVQGQRQPGIEMGLSGPELQNLLLQSNHGSGPMEYSLSTDSNANFSGSKERNVQVGNTNGLPSQLSGGDYLNTLNVVNGAGGSARNFGFNQNQSESELGQGMKEELRKGGLKSIEGGLKNKKTSFSDSVDEAQLRYGSSGGVAASTFAMEGKGQMKSAGEVNAPVTQTSARQDRLSTEGLINVSSGIRNAALQGGGEMRVRLKPDHLGELNITVTTNGSHVGIQIQASSEKARRVLEESMGHLKDSLSMHQLALGNVDISVNNNKMSTENNQQFSGQNPAFQEQFDRNASQGHQRERSSSEAGLEREVRQRAPAAGIAMGSGMSQTSRLSSGRLDVRA